MQFPNIYIKVVALKDQRFTTLGDWFEMAGGSFQIIVTRMADWRHTALVLVHELTELIICWHQGVTTEQADKFDQLWENELWKGWHAPEEEAGFDRRCPYRKGHVWGARMERLFAWIMRVNWKKYCAVCNDLMRQYRKL